MPRANLAIAAIFRDEAPVLAEWVLFHRLVGVDRFTLYDNGSADEPARVLRPFIEEGWLELRPWPVPFKDGAARRAYADALARALGEARWLACIDIDEFLFSPRHATLPEALRGFEAHPGVVVRWQCYGSSGRLARTDEPVISRFRRRAETGWVRNRRVKSIVDPERALEPLNPHHFVYRDGALAVTEAKEEVRVRRPRWRWKKRLRPLFGLLGPLARRIDPYAGADISSAAVSVDLLRINHYPVKSREEFDHKARLKEGKGRYDGVDYFAYHDRNEVEDPILVPYLPSLEAEMRRYGLAAGAPARRAEAAPC